MKTYIFGMSKSKSDIWDDLENNSLELFQHLLKIFWFTNVGNLTHWKEEIPKFAHRVHRLKGGNKYPKSDFIYKALTDEQLPKFERINLGVIKDNPKYNAEHRNSSDAMKFVLEYIEWLAHSLSKNGNVNAYEIWDEIDLLIDKYNLINSKQ